MVADNSPRHEAIDARIWDGAMRQWWGLAPWEELSIEGRADWTVTKASITVGDEHPQAARLRSARHTPVPVSFGINGVRWDGYVDDVESGQRDDGTRYVIARMHSESKHFHRMLARGPVVSAADDTAREVRMSLGQATRELVAEGAARTGLPTYVIIDDPGDQVELEVRSEDYIADVLADPMAGSSSFVEVRKLLPGDELPGFATVNHYQGALERRFEDEQLAAGAWPQATTHPRIMDKVAVHVVPMPRNSWRGEGLIDENGEVLDEPLGGVCWVPFDIEPPQKSGYYGSDTPPEGVFVASKKDLVEQAGEWQGRPHHVTQWKAGNLSPQTAPKLGGAAKAGRLYTPAGRALHDWDEVREYISSGAAWAWHTPTRWVLANIDEFHQDQKKYSPRGSEQRQTPGVLVWQHSGRDRRGVVFSSTPGGGLTAWSTTESGADGAMIIAGGQLDAQTIARLQALGTRPLGMTGELEAGSINAYKGDDGVVQRLDVDAQPAATIQGTDVSYSSIGGRVNINSAGPFFLREKYMNLSTSGVNPVSEIGREWAQAQGSTSITLTPGHHHTVVFGDDIYSFDGYLIPGWKPGDRVSFVDKDTRVSEVIMGYEIYDTPGQAFTATPILGRQVNGVLADLGKRLRDAERMSAKALMQPQRRVEKKEVVETVDASPVGDRVRQAAANIKRVRELLYTELGDVSGELAKLRGDLESGLSDGARLMGSLADAVGRVSGGTKWASLEGDELAQAIVFTLQAQDTLNQKSLSFHGLVQNQLAVQAVVNEKQGEWNENTERILALINETDELQNKHIQALQEIVEERKQRQQGDNELKELIGEKDSVLRGLIDRQVAEEAKARKRVDADLLKKVEDVASGVSSDISAQLADVVRKADFSEYDGKLQKRLWGRQGEFNRISSEFQDKQSQINRQQDEINKANDKFKQTQLTINNVVDTTAQENSNLIKTVNKQVNTLFSQLKSIASGIWEVGAPGDGIWRTERRMFNHDYWNFLIAEGDWVGKAVVTYHWTTGSGEKQENYSDSKRLDIGTTREFRLGHRGWGESLQSVVVHYQKEEGRLYTKNLVIRAQTATQSYSSVTQRFVTPVASEYLITMELSWENAHRGALYGLRISAHVNGGIIVLEEITRSQIGPLTPLGNGYYTMTLSTSRSLPDKAHIMVEAMCNHSGTYQRQIADGNVTISWTS